MGECDAPTRQINYIERRWSIADFMADDAADGCTANRSECAAACQNGTTDSTDARTDAVLLS